MAQFSRYLLAVLNVCNPYLSGGVRTVGGQGLADPSSIFCPYLTWALCVLLLIQFLCHHVGQSKGCYQFQLKRRAKYV